MLIILLGASGAGKSTLERNLCKLDPEIQAIISTTTRNKREGEVDGVHYNFVRREDFKKDEMAEWAEFSSNLYGTSKQELTKAEKLVLSMEPRGASILLNYLKTTDINAKVVFLDIDLETRIKNMKKRGDDEESLRKRLASDDVKERMEKSGITPDLVVNKLKDSSIDLAKEVLESLNF